MKKKKDGGFLVELELVENMMAEALIAYALVLIRKRNGSLVQTKVSAKTIKPRRKK